MKFLYKLAVAVLVVSFAAGCREYADFATFENADVDFTYNVAGDEYLLDFYVVSTVQFNNTSAKEGSYKWNFGDGTTSTEKSPTHKYDAAGNYEVTLTIDGVGSRTYPIMIYDITPSLTVATQTTEIIEFGNTELTFNLELPNPEDLTVKYEWTFPEGTQFLDGTAVTSFVGYGKKNEAGEYEIEYPDPVKFNNIGSQRIDIKTTFDTEGQNRRLADVAVNVQVGTPEPAPTIYYAQYKGNIKAIKVLDNVPAGVKVMPYDLGVPTGSTVLNMLCNTVTSVVGEEGETVSQDWIYILDAGKNYIYQNDENGVLGDGQMTAMKADGTGVNLVVTNVGQKAFGDPFRGFIKDGVIYYSDRNTGFSSIDCTARGEVQSVGTDEPRASYICTNSNTPFKDQGISWGAITCGLYKDKNGYWWRGCNGNGTGIFRFRDSDIYESETEAKKHPLPSAVLLNKLTAITTFAVDETRGFYYVYDGASASFYQLPIPADYKTAQEAKDATFTKQMAATQDNTTVINEGIFVSQMAIDPESGKVYFCFRPDASDASGVTAGIAVFDPATNTVTNYGDTSDLGTAIVFNPTKTKLF